MDLLSLPVIGNGHVKGAVGNEYHDFVIRFQHAVPHEVGNCLGLVLPCLHYNFTMYTEENVGVIQRVRILLAGTYGSSCFGCL